VFRVQTARLDLGLNDVIPAATKGLKEMELHAKMSDYDHTTDRQMYRHL
jgi:hypothetical protein